ncbi:MAG: hypothetical protein CL535_16445 [Ahrensia sp.]|nr:hypothetical protein [Ahrensia sp.]MBV48163.1 hypothetical protein [Roseobacter sp.]MBV48264.1 hypothetical protein [Roseobacter sp.]|tara:strand:+ start:134982 stop:135206 length:225 start_codon:yes stop_codon:yes gene_type:complete
MTHELPNGWTEASKDGIATNADPDLGGIIDSNIVSGEWFVIFNSDHIADIDGLPSKAAALVAHAAAIRETYVLA